LTPKFFASRFDFHADAFRLIQRCVYARRRDAMARCRRRRALFTRDAAMLRLDTFHCRRRLSFRRRLFISLTLRCRRCHYFIIFAFAMPFAVSSSFSFEDTLLSHCFHFFDTDFHFHSFQFASCRE
jgi:hypothetical protein